MSDHIISRQEGSTFYIKINRPSRKNALTLDMYAQMADALNRAADDDAVRCVIFHGNASCFTAGNDLNDFLTADFADPAHPTLRFMNTLHRFDKPVIAAVAGPAIGIGTTMLLHCDFVIAADNTRFQMPFAPLGLCPEFAASFLLQRFVGKRKADELLVLGQPFTATQAEQWGLINRVCTAEELMPGADHIAGTLAELPRHAVQAARNMLREADQPTVEQVIADELDVFRQCLAQPETRRRLEAFFQR